MNAHARASLAALLALLMIAIPLTACGDGKPTETTAAPTVTAAPTTESGETTSPVETQPSTGLEAIDYEEAVFMIGSVNYNNNYNDINCVEAYGESVNDAKVKRNRVIEEKYNITIKNQMESNVANLANAVTKSVNSSTHTYDLVLNDFNHTMSAANREELYSIADIPHLDMTKPWWRAQSLTDTSINHINYFVVGDINLHSYTQTPTMLFNKQLVKDFSLENPYDIVREGQWTYDTMMELGAMVVADLDGNGMGEFDRYALTCNAYASDCFALGADRLYVAKDTDDLPYVNMDDEKLMNFWEKVVSFLNSDDVQYGEHYPVDNGRQRVPQATFSSGRSLFWVESMGWVDTLRDMEIDFGLLPMPKADYKQEKYTNSVHTNGTSVSLPITADDDLLDRNGRIIEDLAAESMRYVRPAYYDNALEGRYLRDAESGEMLDLILLNVRYDLMLIMTSTVDVKDLLRETIMLNNPNLSSIIAENSRSWSIMLKRAIKSFTE